MKSRFLPPLAVLATTLIIVGDLLAQVPEGNSPPPIPNLSRRRVINDVNESPENQLKQNYRIFLTIASGGDKKQECSILTASRQVKGNLYATEIGGLPVGLNNPTPIGMRVSFSGVLDETDAGIRFQCSLSASIPVPNSIQNSEKGTSITNYSYSEEGVTSSLLLKPGKAYELLKSGGRTYTLRVEVAKDGE